MTNDTKPSNPKQMIGATKLPIHLVPTTGIEEEALAFLEGALKYGKFNWRAAGVRSSTYLDAILRHLFKYMNGEDRDPDTLVHHLANIRACTNIILDAELNGMLTDDRAPRSPNSQHIDATVKRIAHLKELFKDHNPHQYSLLDEQENTDGNG